MNGPVQDDATRHVDVRPILGKRSIQRAKWIATGIEIVPEVSFNRVRIIGNLIFESSDRNATRQVSEMGTLTNKLPINKNQLGRRSLYGPPCQILL